MSLADEIIDYGWQQGFGVARLEDDTRLHLWMPQWKNVDCDFIHSHNYYFRSQVLIGEMRGLELRVEPHPEGTSALVMGEVNREKLDNPQPCHLHLVGNFIVRTGCEYEFGGPDRYHAIAYKNPIMTRFKALSMPEGQKSGFIIPFDLAEQTKKLIPRPTKAELEKVMLELLEEHGL